MNRLMVNIVYYMYEQTNGKIVYYMYEQANGKIVYYMYEQTNSKHSILHVWTY